MCTYAAVDTDTTVTVEHWMGRQPASSTDFARMAGGAGHSGRRVQPVDTVGVPVAWHDFGSAAVIIDYIRRRAAQKRGAGAAFALWQFGVTDFQPTAAQAVAGASPPTWSRCAEG